MLAFHSDGFIKARVSNEISLHHGNDRRWHARGLCHTPDRTSSPIATGNTSLLPICRARTESERNRADGSHIGGRNHD